MSKAFGKLQESDLELVLSVVDQLGTETVVIDDEAFLYCVLVVGGAVNRVRDIELGIDRSHLKFGNELRKAIDEDSGNQ